MKILITGGAGFIGSHLTRRLIGDGHEITIIDNLSTGSLENLGSIADGASLKFIEGDILDKTLMVDAAKECEVIYHLAAAVGVSLIVDQPVMTIETNIGGTEQVLDAANKYGRKIFLASSSEVYGKSESIPFCEDDDIVLGSTSLSRWAYACSKAIDEFLGVAFYHQYGLEVVIGRFFNTIGPRQTGKYGMVVPRFVERAVRNEAIEIYGTGGQSRCFCFVGDVIEAVISLMDCPEAAGRVFNIGSTEEITIEKLADLVVELCDSKSEKKFVTYEKAYGKPIEDMMRRVPSIERINSAIGWEAQTDLRETLRKIIASFRES